MKTLDDNRPPNFTQMLRPNTRTISFGQLVAAFDDEKGHIQMNASAWRGRSGGLVGRLDGVDLKLIGLGEFHGFPVDHTNN